MENTEADQPENAESDSSLDELANDILTDTPEESKTVEGEISKELSANNRYIQKMDSHIESTKERTRYAVERFDILIISLSGGGLVLSISLVKDVIRNFEKIDHSLLKLTWISFGLSLVLNLFSQITAYYANREEIKISKSLIRQKRNKPVKYSLKKLEVIKCTLDGSTVGLNAISVLSFVTAIVLMIIFMNKYV